MIRISQLKISISQSKSLLPELIAKHLKINRKDIINFTIYKESIDARRGAIVFVYTVDVKVKNEEVILAKKLPGVKPTPDMQYNSPPKITQAPAIPPIVVGFGPAGMYAALLLAQCGYNPIVLERGEAINERTASVENFWNNGILNPESNVQFGEGGAGTFSDGKLTTRVKDLRGRKVLEELVSAGAPKEILYAAHPHVGTDLLRDVVVNIRKQIIDLGGKIYFNSKVTDFVIKDDQIKGVVVNNNKTISSEHVILAIGHSARDTFEKIYNANIDITSKPFAVGVRIEHPQTIINVAQYKEFHDHPALGAAEYRLTHQASNGRGTYTFCMCPGGFVVPSSSEEEQVVTNGMSLHSRSEENANSGLLVTVDEADFGSDHPLAGITFQRELEKKAFILGGSNYKAPAQLVSDFINNKSSDSAGSVKPSYAIGVKWCNLNDILPKDICDSMIEALLAMDKKITGFAMGDAVLTAVETRSSSPVRIPRTLDLQSTNVRGLYPAAEGAGYAGGIVSSAIDGLKCAEALINNFK